LAKTNWDIDPARSDIGFKSETSYDCKCQGIFKEFSMIILIFVNFLKSNSEIISPALRMKLNKL